MEEEQKKSQMKSDMKMKQVKEASLNEVSWENFWEKHSVERDLQEAGNDLRDAFQAFD